MRKLILFFSVFFLLSCNREQTRENIEKQIDVKKNKINELKQEIIELEKKMQTLLGENHSAFQQLVELQELTPQKFSHYITLTGNVEAVHGAFVSPEASGQIKKIHIKEGQSVIKGQLLVSLNTSVTTNAINEVKTQLELVTKLFEKQEKLWKQKIGSEIQYLEAKTNKESLESKLKTLQSQMAMSLITAPFAGIVDEIYRKEGEMATPGMQLVQLVNLSELKIEADISEKYIYQIKEGDKVEVSFPTYSEDNFFVPIIRKGNVIEPDNRTFKIEVNLRNKDGKIKPNMLATVKVKDFSSDSALVVPSVILKNDLEGTYCYKAIEKDSLLYAKKVYLAVEKTFNDLTMLKSGVNVGDKIITTGYNLVSDGLNIKLNKN